MQTTEMILTPDASRADRVAARIVVQAQARSRRGMLMGREHVIVPAVIVREQVLNNNLGRAYLPAEELTEDWVGQWNGVPVIIDHPSKRGVPVSARDPEVLNSRGVGFLYGARLDGTRILADAYLDPARAEAVQELGPIIEAVEAGEAVELSTGFPTAVQKIHGEHEGRPFDLIMRPRGVDHLAIFLDKTGACSVADGCGLGVNCGCSGETAAQTREVLQMDTETAGKFMQAVEKFTAFFSRHPRGEPAENESDEDRRKMLSEALRSQFGSPLRHIWIVAVYSDEDRVVFEVESEAEGYSLLQATYTLDPDGQVVSFTEPSLVRQVTEFVPAANDGEDPPAADAGPTTTPKDIGRETAMIERQKIIAQLSKVCPLPAERLEGLEEAELTALHASYGVQEGEGHAPAPAEKPAANAQTEAGESRVLSVLETLTAAVNEIREAQASDREALGLLREIVEPTVQERASEHAALVAELSANERVPYEETELQAKPVEELRKLQALSRGTNYAGRGGPRVTSTNAEEPAFIAPRPYWQPAPQGADRKEAN